MFCQSTKPLALAIAALLALSGCRNRGVNTEPLELENFALNEKILHLEMELAEVHAHLEREQLKEKDDEDDDSSDRSRGSSERRDEQPELPDIELGDPVKPNGQDEKLPSAPKFESRRRSTGRSVAQPVSSAQADVTYITLNANETAAFAGGDEDGLVVVLEPRDASGKLVRAAGQIAIAVWDQELLDVHRGNRARQSEAQMGVWTFTTSEVQSHLDQSSDGRIRIELPWPHQPPDHGRVRVYVRYVTYNGQELRAELPLVAERAGQAGEPEPEPVQAEELPAPPPQTVRDSRQDDTTLQFPRPEESAPPERAAGEPDESTGASNARKPEQRQDARDARRPRWSPHR